MVGDGANNAISNTGTGALTLTSAANVNVDEDLTHAGNVTVNAAGGGTLAGRYTVTQFLLLRALRWVSRRPNW